MYNQRFAFFLFLIWLVARVNSCFLKISSIIENEKIFEKNKITNGWSFQKIDRFYFNIIISIFFCSNSILCKQITTKGTQRPESTFLGESSRNQREWKSKNFNFFCYSLFQIAANPANSHWQHKKKKEKNSRLLYNYF